MPVGQFQFHLQSGKVDFQFEADRFDWLVLSAAGTRAEFAGAGTVEGHYEATGSLDQVKRQYSFFVTVIDGGGKVPDRFRLRVWDPATGAALYDNQFGAPEDADPTGTVLSGRVKFKTGS